MPRSIEPNQKNWNTVDIYDWTSGFWPGILWYDYEETHNKSIEVKATEYTECLFPLLSYEHKNDHDIGFQIFCSFGNAYRLTKNNAYKKAILIGANKLASLYNPKVGTILSWPWIKNKAWPYNTIMDNMMNLEILFWAARNGGSHDLYDIAVSHATVTMKNSFRKDGGNYHVAVYDTIDGHFIKGVTNQGYSDNSLWARGQAWAIYGYTMVYRETRDKVFLRFAEKVTNLYLRRLPADYIPYWDFDAPDLLKQPKDASAAAITAAALLELSTLEDNARLAKKYFNASICMLKELSSKRYRDKGKPSFLLHSTGNYPAKYEIDASINYADYYYIQALLRYKEMLKRSE
jgi:unsaturated chondroitin disaccharide hydrolase